MFSFCYHANSLLLGTVYSILFEFSEGAISEYFMQFISQRSHHLHLLEYCQAFWRSQYIRLFQHSDFPRLTSLTLSGLDSTGYDLLDLIAIKCPQLCHLALQFAFASTLLVNRLITEIRSFMLRHDLISTT